VNEWAGYPGGRVGQWENRSDITVPNDYETDQATLQVDWDISDAMSLMFLTAHTEQEAISYTDWDNSPYGLVNDLNENALEVTSQEIQITGGNDRFTWVGGVYYWEQENHARGTRWQLEEFYHPNNGTPNFYGDREGYNSQAYDVNTVFATPHCNPTFANGTPIPQVALATPNPAKPWLVRFEPGAVDSLGRPIGGAPVTGAGAWQTCQQAWDSVLTGSFDALSTQEQDGWAIFGEVSIKLGETWDLTVGLRQHDQSGYSQNKNPIAGVTAPKADTVNKLNTGGDSLAGVKTGIPAAFEFDKLTSRISLQKTFSDDTMLYFTYSEGFNSGGISAPIIRGVRTEYPFDPATLVNYEIGLRTDMADGRVRFNATVFHDVWEDMQVAQAVLDPVTGQQLPTLVTANVATSEADGVEFEFTWAPIDQFLMNVNLGFLDTGYTEIAPGLMSGHLPLTTGTEFQLAPDSSWSLGFQHNGNLSGGGALTSRLDVMYQGQFWRNEPFLRVDAYDAVPDGFDESGDWTTVNARISYEPANAAWAVSVFGTNLTDEYMLNSGFFHGIWGYDFATVGRPREYGVSMNVRF
jgi:outer membrane receptor protein involved in Fe transport